MRIRLSLLPVLLLLAPMLFGASARIERTITVSPDALVRFAAISPKGDFLAGACKDGQLRVWAYPSGELRQAFNLQDQGISAARFSDDGTLLAVGGNRGAVKIWTLPAGKLKAELKVGPAVDGLAISPDKTMLAVARHELPAELWDLDVGRVITELPGKFSGSAAVDFSPDGQWVASADTDTEIRIYESHTGALRATTSDLLLETFAISFSSDSKLLYAGGADKTISAIDVATGKIYATFPKQAFVVGALARSPDGKSLAAAYFDDKSFSNPAPVLLWDPNAASIRTTFSEKDVTPNGCGFAKNGAMLVTNSAGPKLQIWAVR
jgi:WD40 repeat protein